MHSYRILVDSQLDPEWAGWLGEMQVDHLADGTTLLTGDVHDQSALYGLIIKLRDLGITLLSVEALDGRDAGES